MSIALGIAAAGAVGTLLRVLVTNVEGSFRRQLYGTFAVNVIGSFFLGLLSASEGNAAIIIGVGGLGAATTFSTFISQIERLNREDSATSAATYVIASVIIGVTSALVGIALAR